MALTADTGKPADLAAYYPMDGDFKDKSGNGNDLVMQDSKSIFSADTQIKAIANTVYGPTVPDRAKYGAVGKIKSVDMAKGLTMSCFYLQGTSEYAYTGDLLGFGIADWGKPSIMISALNGVISAKVGSRVHYKRYNRLEVGNWHHLALVVPPKNSGNENYDLYIDGKCVLSEPVEYMDNIGVFRIGDFSGKPANIMLDEVKVFNRALSAGEIQAEAALHGKIEKKLFSSGKGGQQISGEQRRKAPEDLSKIKIQGKLRVEALDKDWICVVGYYHDFMCERFKIECGDFLKKIEDPAYRPPDWSREMHYNFAGTEVICAYRPLIARAYQQTGGFSVSRPGQTIKIDKSGYWLNPVSLARFPDFGGGEAMTRNAEVAHFAFLKLSEPLESNLEYEVKTPLGELVKFKYDDKITISAAIKVNQVGYAPEAGRKYAYLGAWLGELGPLDFSAWNGQNFFLIDAFSGAESFTGKIELRGKDVFYKNGAPFTGETVYQMDFSSFKTPGNYYIRIPGIGRSWEFTIGPDALGEAFYIHARGLYHKRCGIAKELPYTEWVCGDCHMKTFAGGFPPDEGHYSKAKDGEKRDWGFFNSAGESVELNHFDVIKATATTTELPGVHGGWHDAADYDRRNYHFSVVNDLLSAYLMFPENFADGQLNIPESGNGIPDIIDEARWGVEVWRLAQNAQGGVGCWIEATSHPLDNNPHTDKQPYYLALPTRESTMDYAAHAAMLALALQKAGATADSELYLKSAVKAFNYANDPANRIIRQITCPVKKDNEVSNVEYTYKEPAIVPPEFVFKAAFNLYVLTGEDRYLYECKKASGGFEQYIYDMFWRGSPFYFVDFWVFRDKTPALANEKKLFKQLILKNAEDYLNALNNNYPYRIPWFPNDHGYVVTMAWGTWHPLVRSRFFIVAWYMTGEEKYRDAALLCNDWHNGANPMGETMTSGLGKVYPVRFLDLPSYTDGIEEFVPGITPYRNIFGIPREDVQLAHGLFFRERKDHNFNDVGITLLPDSITGGKKLNEQETAEALYKNWPVWRRYANVEGFTVPVSEYTVWQTIAPAAAVTGCLLKPGWMPSETLKKRKPAASIKDLPGFIPLP